MEKSSKNVSLPLVLFEFIESDCVAGVGTLGSIYKPPLPESLSESVLMVHSWITSSQHFTIRWQKKCKNNWNDKIYGNCSTEDPEDEFRLCRAVMLSEDKDFLKKHLQMLNKKSALAKEAHQLKANKVRRNKGNVTISTNSNNIPVSIATKSKPLSASPTARKDDPRALTENCDGDQHTGLSPKTDDAISLKRRLVQENQDLKKKVARLENEKEEERKILSGQIMELEEQLGTLEKLCKDKATEVSNLTETLEKLHADQLAPGVLIQHMTDLISVIKTDSEKRQGEFLRLSNQFASFPSSSVSTPCSSQLATPTKRLVKFDGDILIDPDALKNAIAYGSTANTDHNLNLMINTILDAFYKQSELAAFSLSGKPCPNMKGSKAKPKIPAQIMQALKNFIRRHWKQWYQVVPTDKAINSGVGAKLRSCHTAAKKQQKKSTNAKISPIINEDDIGNDSNNLNSNTLLDDNPGDDLEDIEVSSSFEEIGKQSDDSSSADENENEI